MVRASREVVRSGTGEVERVGRRKEKGDFCTACVIVEIRERKKLKCRDVDEGWLFEVEMTTCVKERTVGGEWPARQPPF